MIVIKGGTILTDAGPLTADVAVDGAVVVDVGTDVSTDDAQVIDATDALVGPGFVDIHTHLRDPGQTWKEDIVSGCDAAAAGGYTAVMAMPNTDPALDEPDVIRELIRRASEDGRVEVAVAAALTKGRKGEEPSDLQSLYAVGTRMFSDDGDSVENVEVLREIMLRLAVMAGSVVSQHAEDRSIAGRGHMHAGDVAMLLGVEGLPASAETEVVARDLGLVRETGCAYHAQHVSAAATVDLIRQAKAERLPVTAEVTPHHLYFIDEDVEGLDPNLKMYPPLRTRSDRAALGEALRDGTIDAVATDHAPHSPDEKAVPFVEAPRGVIGLETAAAVAWMTLEDPKRLFEVMSVAPARIGGFRDQGHWIAEGAPANLAIFDPTVTWVPERFLSRSSNSPFRGEKLVGRVLATIYRGMTTHRLKESDE